MNIKGLRSAERIGLLLLLGITTAHMWAQMPPGLGRDETQRVCSSCHELERSISLRQDRDGWKATINKMVSLGTVATDQEFSAILDYLSANYPAAAIPRLNVNTAPAIEFESRLTLKRSEAAAIIKYRTEHGNFKSIEDLKKVPSIDPAKIEAKRNILIF